MSVPTTQSCPITLEIIKNPVINCFGTVYEKEAIEKWYSKNDTDPQSNTTVFSKLLVDVSSKSISDLSDWKYRNSLVEKYYFNLRSEQCHLFSHSAVESQNYETVFVSYLKSLPALKEKALAHPKWESHKLGQLEKFKNYGSGTINSWSSAFENRALGRIINFDSIKCSDIAPKAQNDLPSKEFQFLELSDYDHKFVGGTVMNKSDSFDGAILKNITFRDFTFPRVSFIGTTFENVKFINCTFKGEEVCFIGACTKTCEDLVFVDCQVESWYYNQYYRGKDVMTAVQKRGLKAPCRIIISQQIYDSEK